MTFLLTLLSLFFNIAFLVIILQVAVSWLIAFDVINTKNQQAQNLLRLLHKLTEPVYSRIRRFIPPIGGIDLTPLVVMIALSILQSILFSLLG